MSPSSSARSPLSRLIAEGRLACLWEWHSRTNPSAGCEGSGNNDHALAMNIGALPSAFHVSEWHLLNVSLELARFDPFPHLLCPLSNSLRRNAGTSAQQFESRCAQRLCRQRNGRRGHFSNLDQTNAVLGKGE